MKQEWRAILLALVAAGCGGKTGTLLIDIVVSPVDDPFADATAARFTVGDSSHVKTFPVTGGHFSASLDLSPLKNPGPVIVEALDAGGNVVAHGQTPNLLLQPQNQEVAVWVGRPGHIAAARAALGKPLAEFAAVMVPGLGIVYAGGRSTDGSALKDATIYDVLTHSVLAPTTSTTTGVPSMQTARAGAVAARAGGADVASSINAVVVGGASTVGFGSTGTPSATSESFSPVSDFGSWSTIATDALPARSYPQSTLLGSGNALISGGLDDSGNRLDSGALLTTTGTVRLGALSTPMAAARAHHATCAAKFPDGDGAILIGGLADGLTAPVGERLVGQSFSAYDVTGMENRQDATATLLASGSVLVVGGSVGGVAQQSGWVIDPSTTPPSLTNLPSALSAARTGHSATVVGSDVLVCGGAGADGKGVASCDLIDGSTYAIKSTVALGNARRGHSALALETGPIVIAGGFGDDGQPLSSIEIYTP